MGKLFKGLVKFSVAAATVGGLCYVFKDQIRESKVYKEHDMDDKIKKMADTIKEKIPAVFDNEDDFVDEDETIFDDLDLAAEDIEREYVSITPSEEAIEDIPTEEAPSDKADTTSDEA